MLEEQILSLPEELSIDDCAYHLTTYFDLCKIAYFTFKAKSGSFYIEFPLLKERLRIGNHQGQSVSLFNVRTDLDKRRTLLIRGKRVYVYPARSWKSCGERVRRAIVRGKV